MDVWVVMEYTDCGDFYVNSVWSDENEARKAAKHRIEVECGKDYTYRQIDDNTWEAEGGIYGVSVEVVQRYLRH